MGSLKIKTNFPIVWGDLAYQNQWLRRIAIMAIGLALLSTLIVAVLLKRKPQIVVIDSQAYVVSIQGSAPLENEIEKATRRYLELRYVWQPDNQSSQLSSAKSFVAPQSLRAFEKTSADLVTFSKGKNVAQRVYPTSIHLNAKESRVEVVADRFTEIQGLKAATVLRVNLIYQTGPRTSDNPWGIYIIKEEEVQ